MSRRSQNPTGDSKGGRRRQAADYAVCSSLRIMDTSEKPAITMMCEVAIAPIKPAALRGAATGTGWLDSRGVAMLEGLMRAAIFLLITMIAGIFGAGCATPSKCRPAEVAPGILDGCKPRTQEDFETLRKQGIRTILSLETLPWNIRPQRRLARKNGIAYRNVPILASPLKPREKPVKEALLTLPDEYLH